METIFHPLTNLQSRKKIYKVIICLPYLFQETSNNRVGRGPGGNGESSRDVGTSESGAGEAGGSKPGSEGGKEDLGFQPGGSPEGPC